MFFPSVLSRITEFKIKHYWNKSLAEKSLSFLFWATKLSTPEARLWQRMQLQMTTTKAKVLGHSSLL
jgi:hypothetical protein